MITTLLDQPFFFSVASTSLVPAQYPVAIAGHPYMVDLMSDQTGLRGQYFRRASVPVLRVQANTTNQPDESSLSPDDLWRRTDDDWSLGAGQNHFDRSASNSRRFRASKGVNVWTRWQVTLLNDTAQILSATNSNLRSCTAGTYLYICDGTTIKWSSNATSASPTWTTVTPANAVTSMCSDGDTVYVGEVSGNIQTTTRGAATMATTSVALQPTLMAYIKGRLMAAQANNLYNITSLASTPAALYTHPNADFTWVGFAGAQSFIYCAGFSGDKSLIYFTTIKADGTALDVPKIAGELPDGEVVSSILGYQGFVVIGTTQGVRLATPNGDGSLTIGALISLGVNVQALSGFGRFVWFGWTNYDASSTGMGRLDLSNSTDDIGTPAYASDLMASASGVVSSISQVSGTQVFCVVGQGVYAPTANLVSQGYFDSGLINYGIADPKVAMYVDLKTQPLVGSVTVFLSTDSGTFNPIGTHSNQGTTGPAPTFSAGQAVGESFELREILYRSATTPTTGPTFTRQTMRAYPVPARSYSWVVPLLIHEQMQPYGDQDYPMMVQTELNFLFSLVTQRSLVPFQVGANTYQVFVEDVIQLPYQLTSDKSAYSSTLIVALKEPSA